MGELLNSGSRDYTLKELRDIRTKIQTNWEESGLLEGLSGNTKENIALLYECCASSLLSGDTKGG
jgi:hypothetical protein